MPLPLQAAQAMSILQKLAGAGGGPAPAAAAAPSPSTRMLAEATQQLDGANPQGMADGIRQINATLAQFYLQAAMRVPAAADPISKARSALDKALKELQAATQAVQAAAPILNSAGVGPMAGQTPGAGAPNVAAMLGS